VFLGNRDIGEKERKMARRKAFTLIELLVVIAIIALLLSILSPALNRVKREARKILCMSNHKQIGLGLLAFATNHDEKFPEHPGQGGNGAPYYYVQNRNNLARDILDYVGETPQIFVCPVAPPGVEPPNPDLRAPQTFRWNFYYMANYVNEGLNYISPVTRSTAASINGLWSEHTADVGGSWGNIRASHVRGSAGKYPDTLEGVADYGSSYLQWSVVEDEKIDDVTCVYVDGSCDRLKLEQMYYAPTQYGGNWYPPTQGYGPNYARP